jgi:hypothetical protein
MPTDGRNSGYGKAIEETSPQNAPKAAVVATSAVMISEK